MGGRRCVQSAGTGASSRARLIRIVCGGMRGGVAVPAEATVVGCDAGCSCGVDIVCAVW